MWPIVRHVEIQKTWPPSLLYVQSAYNVMYPERLCGIFTGNRTAASKNFPVWRLTTAVCSHHHHHHHHHVRPVSCSSILKMQLVPPSLPRSSYVPSSCFLFLDPQDAVGPSISSSVVLCPFVLSVYIVVLILAFYLCSSSVCVLATFSGTVLFPLLSSVLLPNIFILFFIQFCYSQ